MQINSKISEYYVTSIRALHVGNGICFGLDVLIHSICVQDRTAVLLGADKIPPAVGQEIKNNKKN